MKKYLIILASLFFSAVSFAQIQPQLSQRHADILFFNPAVAGSKLNQEIQLHHRTQWTGFEGAPRTQIFSYNGAFSDASGLGGCLYNDKSKGYQNYGLNLSYAYHLPLESFNFAMGLATTLSKYVLDTREIRFYQSGDPLLFQEVQHSKITPDFIAGLYAYNTRFYAGLSTSRSVSGKLKESDLVFLPMVQNYYFVGGLNFNLGDEVVISPEIVGTYATATPLQYQIGVKAVFDNKFIVASDFRSKDAIVFLFGIRLFDMVYAAYSYDYVYSMLRSYNSGSHEVIISFVLARNKSNPIYKNKHIDKNRRTFWQ
jgi:type IX secretion system PorP/SprF family membrane protein